MFACVAIVRRQMPSVYHHLQYMSNMAHMRTKMYSIQKNDDGDRASALNSTHFSIYAYKKYPLKSRGSSALKPPRNSNHRRSKDYQRLNRRVFTSWAHLFGGGNTVRRLTSSPFGLRQLSAQKSALLIPHESLLPGGCLNDWLFCTVTTEIKAGGCATIFRKRWPRACPYFTAVMATASSL